VIGWFLKETALPAAWSEVPMEVVDRTVDAANGRLFATLVTAASRDVTLTGDPNG
jgi:hypothetical protein